MCFKKVRVLLREWMCENRNKDWEIIIGQRSQREMREESKAKQNTLQGSKRNGIHCFLPRNLGRSISTHPGTILKKNVSTGVFYFNNDCNG